MPGLELLVAVAVGYLIGAVPSGVLVGRLRGVDVRASGSGRTGATNALRALGPRWGAVVGLMDLAKGIVAVLAGNALGPEPWAGALAGIAAVAGHVRSIFIGFGGGRGVATGAGAMLILAPLAVLIALVEFAIIVWRTRFVSLGSIMASITVAVTAAALFAAELVGVEAVVAAAVIGSIVVIAHADNIERLRTGTERRLGGG